MKVLVLVHHSLIPPERTVVKSEWEIADWKTEYDVVRGLKEAGHQVQVLGVADELRPISLALSEFKPKIVFNLLEEFAGEAIYDQNVVSYLELKGVKYTGCGPRGLILGRDKALAKKILTYHRIPTPKFYVFKCSRSSVHFTKSMKFPLFVKALSEEASLGITQDSIVQNVDQLKERIRYFHDKFSADVIAESFIDGRELYVGVIGNQRLKVLPPWELFFNKISGRTPRVATSKVKWDINYRKKYGINTGPAENLDASLLQRIQKICKRAYRALEINGYARLDLRINEEGEVFVIEVNPNPDIGYKEDFAESAEAAGISYPQLLDKIIKIGL